MDDARRVREFWFGKPPLSREALDERMKVWFAGEDSAPLAQQQDAAIRSEFGARVEAALRGELASWADGPRRRLSLIILLDQFPRHLYRGRARAFAGDEQALALALSGMQSGADAALDPVERIFFYMPLQNSESPEVQEESVAAYRRLLGLGEDTPLVHADYGEALVAMSDGVVTADARAEFDRAPIQMFVKRRGIQIARALIDEVGRHIADAGLIGRVLGAAAVHGKFHGYERHGGILHKPGFDTPGRNQVLDLGGGVRRRRHDCHYAEAHAHHNARARRADLWEGHDRFSTCLGVSSLMR